jgi:hypothetical protein
MGHQFQVWMRPYINKRLPYVNVELSAMVATPPTLHAPFRGHHLRNLESGSKHPAAQAVV